jgi:SAM-dependent methyltransferase
VGQIIRRIDRAGFHAIHDRYAVENPGEEWPKYLDSRKWIGINLRRVRRLELDFGRRRRVLDLGSGAGYFLYLCRWFGHEAIGLDIDEVPLYREMARLLRWPRVVWRIAPFVPLPDLGGKFDLITGFMICFNNHNRADLWGAPEWDFFLTDLRRHLKPDGRIWFELNRERDGTFMTDELRQLLESRGARVRDKLIFFNAAPRPSISPDLFST